MCSDVIGIDMNPHPFAAALTQAEDARPSARHLDCEYLLKKWSDLLNRIIRSKRDFRPLIYAVDFMMFSVLESPIPPKIHLKSRTQQDQRKAGGFCFPIIFRLPLDRSLK